VKYADIKRRMDEAMDRFLASIGYDGDIIWPVAKGNHVVLMAFVERRIRWAQVGDRVHVMTGGYVEKTATIGWVHWEWHPDEPDDLRDPASRPLTGRWLSGSPAKPQGQSDEVQAGKPAASSSVSDTPQP